MTTDDAKRTENEAQSAKPTEPELRKPSTLWTCLCIAGIAVVLDLAPTRLAAQAWPTNVPVGLTTLPVTASPSQQAAEAALQQPVVSRYDDRAIYSDPSLSSIPEPTPPGLPQDTRSIVTSTEVQEAAAPPTTIDPRPITVQQVPAQMVRTQQVQVQPTPPQSMVEPVPSTADSVIVEETLWEPGHIISPDYSNVVTGSVCDDFAVCDCMTVISPTEIQPASQQSACGCVQRPTCSCQQNCNSRVHVPLATGCRANSCPDGNCWLSEYQQRAYESCAAQPVEAPVTPPADFSAWWDELIRNQAGLAQQPTHIHVDTLIQSALTNSPHIQVAATAPHIKRTFITEEDAAFDWISFLESRFDDLNDPIGNTLTTGNNDDRFKQREWYSESGVRRRNRRGGEFEIAQRYGILRNNSRFLVPPEQGNSRLELNYTQPLLNGRGRFVNQSLTMLADIDYRTAGDEFLRQMQDHLLLVTEAYWELYRSRANYFQRKKLLESAQRILENLRGRAEVDALDRQVLRATAAVANRKSEIARALTSIRNAESQLRLLVNDPSMLNSSCMEFIPADVPMTESTELPIQEAIRTALTYRPDISQAIQELRATTVRVGVAQNDLLPQLDLFFGTYVAGLNGNSDVFNAVVNQFSDGRPGYNFGVRFEWPLGGNRAANARHDRRKWEYTRAISKFRTVAETAMTEVEVAIREISTTHQEMSARFEAMRASGNEAEYLVDRWQTLPNVDDSATLLLEDLLDSQSRLADEEAAFVQAQVNYAISLVKVRQVLGTLMQVHPEHGDG